MKPNQSRIRRGLWGITDQGLSSVTNFALIVFVARVVSPGVFGAFSIVLGVYVVLSGVGQALVSTPLAVRYSTVTGPQLKAVSRDAAGASVAIGTLLGLGCLITSLLNISGTRSLFLVLGIGLPGLLLQDCWRYMFVVGGESHKAALNDSIWVVVQVVGFTALVATHAGGATSILAVWAGSAGVASVFGCWQARLLPRFGTVGAWLVREGDLGIRYAGETVVIRSAIPFALLLVAAVAGLPVVGGLRGAMVVFSPLNLIFQGSAFVAVPEVVRMFNREPTKAERFILGVSGFALVAAIMIALIALVLPPSAGEQILGRTWTTAEPLLPSMSMQFAAIAASMGPQIGIRALRAAGTSLSIQVFSGVGALVGAPVGAYLAGGVGAATGLAIASTVACVIWWSTYLRMRASATGGNAAAAVR